MKHLIVFDTKEELNAYFEKTGITDRYLAYSKDGYCAFGTNDITGKYEVFTFQKINSPSSEEE